MFKGKLKVGIITSNYNGSKYIDDYLNGLLNQTVLPDYIVFVDDVSTDDSWEIIDDLIWAKAKVMFINNEVIRSVSRSNDRIDATLKNGVQFIGIKRKQNGGPAAGRNTAIKELIGKVDIIGLCDSDDIYYPTKIEKSCEPFLAYGQVGLVYSDYDILNQESGVKTREFKEIFNYERLIHECIISNNSFFNIKVVEAVGMYDEDPQLKYLEDYEFWIRCASYCSVYHIPEALYAYRVHDTNGTVVTPISVLNKRHHIMRTKLENWKRNGGPNV